METDINKDYSISKQYESEDFPSHYKKFLMADYKTLDTFVSECLQKIYHSGRLSGTRLLDFGCGPIVHRIASASLHFNDITLSEWSEANRKEVEKWLRNEKDALDWTPSLEQCARAEGFRHLDKGVAEIEERIRKAVKKVVPCDALSKDILPDGLGVFDVINTSYCLDGCCFTTKVYKEAIQKLAKYLKRSGSMVMVSVLEGQSYDIGLNKMLPAFYLTEDMIKEALDEAGLELRDWFYWRNSGEHNSFKDGGTAVFYSVKR